MLRRFLKIVLFILVFMATGLGDAPAATLDSAEPAAGAGRRDLSCLVQEAEAVELWTATDAELIAKTIYGEAGSDWIPTEHKAAVAWCILNRVDAGRGTIQEVVTAAAQFDGYDPTHPVRADLYDLAVDVLQRWEAEKDGAAGAGRTLPAEYLYFTGDGELNYFTNEWQAGTVWDWSLPSPYNN